MNNIVTMILGKGKGGVARCRLKEAGAKSTSRRTEMSYKAKQAGEFALQNETQDPVRMVNDAVVWRQFTFLSGEICLTCHCLLMARHLVTVVVMGQKSAEAIVDKDSTTHGGVVAGNEPG